MLLQPPFTFTATTPGPVEQQERWNSTLEAATQHVFGVEVFLWCSLHLRVFLT